MKRNGVLIVFSGDPRKIEDVFQRVSGAEKATTILLDERAISEGGRMIKALRGRRAQYAACGCRDLSLQRYQFFIKLFLLMTPADGRWLVDQGGGTLSVHWLSFLRKDVPFFLWEVSASALTLLFSFFHLVLLRMRGSS